VPSALSGTLNSSTCAATVSANAATTPGPRQALALQILHQALPWISRRQQLPPQPFALGSHQQALSYPEQMQPPFCQVSALQTHPRALPSSHKVSSGACRPISGWRCIPFNECCFGPNKCSRRVYRRKTGALPVNNASAVQATNAAASSTGVRDQNSSLQWPPTGGASKSSNAGGYTTGTSRTMMQYFVSWVFTGQPE